MFYKFLATASVCAMTAVSAQAGIDMLGGTTTATVSAFSEYEFRGVAFSDEHSVFQYSADWAHKDNGLKAGIWGSRAVVDGDTPSDYEISTYIGHTGTVLSDKLTYDATAYYYIYPTAEEPEELNYAEYVLGLGYKLHDKVTLGTLVAWSDDNFGTGESQYYEGNLAFSLPMDISLTTGYGYHGFDNNQKKALQDYNNWYAAVSKNIKGFNVGLKFADTNANRCGDNCDERVVFSVGYTF